MKIVPCIHASDSGFTLPTVERYIPNREAVLMALGDNSRSVFADDKHQAWVIDSLGLWLLSDMTRDIRDCYAEAKS